MYGRGSRLKALLLCFLGLALFGVLTSAGPRWGFFGHRKINRMAVFTLPAEMGRFYKKHLEYITEHAVDPDKRRYATKHEAVRHYIDIDHWDTYPFRAVPRDWTDALMKHASISLVDGRNDTLTLTLDSLHSQLSLLRFTDPVVGKAFSVSAENYREFFKEQILPLYYEEEWPVDCQALSELFNTPLDCSSAFAADHFSEFGILPFHLEKMQYQLTQAFREKDVKRILRFSADMGHYIGDAHVPLHTTSNYNGQLTGQEGIHAFWESRLPELFADDHYDFFVGPAQYWDKPAENFWDMVLTSHLLVDSVLQIEQDLSRRFPSDQQFCYEDRLDNTIRTQCEAYSRAFHEAMDGMVEERMAQSILALGSSWFTAWVNAGQPDLNQLEGQSTTLEPVLPPDPSVRSRPHE